LDTYRGGSTGRASHETPLEQEVEGGEDGRKKKKKKKKRKMR
jgi:hypothetical protein